jgi:hypothetical protein
MQRSPSSGGGSSRPDSGDSQQGASSSKSAMDDLTSKAGRDAKEARDAAAEAARKLKNDASATAGDVKEQAQKLAGDAKAAMSELASDAASKARDMAESQKDIGARSLANVARAIHSAAREMVEESPQIARYANVAADRLDEVSKAIKERPLGRLVDDVTGYARQQPVAFLAGSVVLGALLARFLKSSSASERRESAAATSLSDSVSDELLTGEDVARGASGRAQDELFEPTSSSTSRSESLSGGAGGMEGRSQRGRKPDRPPHGGTV